MTDLDLQAVAIQGEHCSFSVYAQGDLENWHGKTYILTVHDVGTNHKSFTQFVTHESMSGVNEQAIFLHVCVPGQQDKALDHDGEFPTLEQLGRDLVYVLDKFNVRKCIAVGQGAGAIVICHFAAAWPTQIMGIVLIPVEYFKDKTTDLRLENGVMTPGAWVYFSLHKFGQEGYISCEHFHELNASLNTKNLSRYLYSYSNCADFSTVIGSTLDTENILVVSGGKAAHVSAAYRALLHIMFKKYSMVVVVCSVDDVVADAPEKLAEAFAKMCTECKLFSRDARRQLLPIWDPQEDAPVDSDKESVESNEDYLLPEEAFCQHSIMPADEVTTRKNDYIRQKFPTILRHGIDDTEYQPFEEDCYRCASTSVITAHSYSTNCKYFHRRGGCSACKQMANEPVVCEIWLHDPAHYSCIYYADVELKLFYQLHSKFAHPTLLLVLQAEMDDSLKDFLVQYHMYALFQFVGQLLMTVYYGILVWSEFNGDGQLASTAQLINPYFSDILSFSGSICLMWTSKALRRCYLTMCGFHCIVSSASSQVTTTPSVANRSVNKTNRSLSVQIPQRRLSAY